MNWPILLQLLPYNENYTPKISNHNSYWDCYQQFGILILLIEFSQKLKHLGKITCDQIFQYIYGYVFIPALILPYASKMLEKNIDRIQNSVDT